MRHCHWPFSSVAQAKSTNTFRPNRRGRRLGMGIRGKPIKALPFEQATDESHGKLRGLGAVSDE